MMRVRTIAPFTDAECGRIRGAGSVFECGEERAAILAARGRVEVIGPSARRPEREPDEPAAEPAAQEADGPAPDAMWTAAEIIAWADAHGIDLAGAKKSKAAMLARIAEG